MIQRIRKLSVESVNKIKYESREEFEESIFCEVYQSASRCITKVIEDNILLKKKEKDGYYEDEQLSNMVAFLGERGMGKSSAMLSYAHFLRSYDEESAGEFKITNISGDKLTFSVLPRIDVAMMGKGESILDIILAKMWDDFYERDKQTGKRSDIFAGEIKEDFNRVKNTYRNYKRITSGKELLQDMTSVRELHELAACMNLRTELKKLVEDYLKYENNKSFLIISLDDLDMAMSDLYESMEQIRLFLMIPKVIILSTINLYRFRMSCKKYLWEKLLCQINISKNDKKNINKYVKDYMAKILPSNMRINIPRLGKVGGIEYEIELDGYLEYIYGEIIPEDLHYDEKELMFTLLANYSDIFFMPYEDEKHFLQDDSLRKLVNKLYVLLNMLKEKEERFELVYQWYFDRLVEYGQDMLDYNLSENLLGIGNRYINVSLVNVLLDIHLEENIVIRGEDYGDILRYLYLVEDNKYKEIFNFIMLLYSIQICSGLKRGVENITSICNNNIFNATLAESSLNTARNGSCLEQKRLLGKLLDTMLFYKERNQKSLSTVEIIKENAGGLMETFLLANFCGVPFGDRTKWRYIAIIDKDEKTEEIPGSGNKNKKKSFAIEAESFGAAYTVSIDNFLFNILKFEENLIGYIKNLYQAIERARGRDGFLEPAKEDLEDILEEDIWKYKSYRSWRKKYGIVDGADIRAILPIQSVELMVYLARNMSKVKRQYISGKGITFEGLREEWVRLLSGLREVEEFCHYKELKGISYSEKLDAYWNMLKPQDISEDTKRKLDMPSEYRASNRPSV